MELNIHNQDNVMTECTHPLYLSGKCAICGTPEPTPGRVQIQLTFNRVACAVHLEPLRAKWPEGYAKFCVDALGLVMADDLFCASVRGEIDCVNDALDEVPLCCRLSAEQLLELMGQCAPLHTARCCNCDAMISCFTMLRKVYPKKIKRSNICLSCFYKK
jgi:hypothetical protein